MSTFFLTTETVRENAIAALRAAPLGWVAQIGEETRTAKQNRLLWPLLTRIAEAKPDGRIMSPEAWKCAFMEALGYEARYVMSLDWQRPVPLGFRSSALKVREFADLVETIMEFGARHEIPLTKPEDGQ